MIKRVLFLSLPAVLEVGDDYLDDGHSFHLGVAYLAAVLRRGDYAVGILDCYAEDPAHHRTPVEDGWLELGLSNEHIVERVRAFAPDLIGLTIPFSCQHDLAHVVAQCLKQAYPDVILVAGGNHVTAVPEQIDRHDIDYLILGEGEQALPQLIDALNHNRPVDGIPGVHARGTVTYQCAPFIEVLDELPYPAIDLLPLEKIWQSGKRWINMIATRGCVYDCSFCSIHTIMGYKLRRRSIENVVAEVEHWYETYHIEEIYFEDDNLTVNRAWAKQLFRALADRHFNIRFMARNGLRADSIDREMLELMRAAGFHDFMISPESGSQRTLDEVIGKNMQLEDCMRVTRLAREVGIGVNAFFVIGFPHETQADLQDTLMYARSLREQGCQGFWISLAAPYPGTRLFRQCQERGLLPDFIDFRRFRTADYAIQHPIFSRDELKAYRRKMMQELAPPPASWWQHGLNAARLLRLDPAFFWRKTRYKFKF